MTSHDPESHNMLTAQYFKYVGDAI